MAGLPKEEPTVSSAFFCFITWINLVKSGSMGRPHPTEQVKSA
jgi:hypothetical protein